MEREQQDVRSGDMCGRGYTKTHRKADVPLDSPVDVATAREAISRRKWVATATTRCLPGGSRINAPAHRHHRLHGEEIDVRRAGPASSSRLAYAARAAGAPRPRMTRLYARLSDRHSPASSQSAVGNALGAGGIGTSVAAGHLYPPRHPQRHEAHRVSKGVAEGDWDHDVMERVKWIFGAATEAGRLEKIRFALAAKAIRWRCRLLGKAPPVLICPRDNKATIQALVLRKGWLARLIPVFRWRRVGRFGLTIRPGPPTEALNAAIGEEDAMVGALLYMFVDEEYRGSGLGIAALHHVAEVQWWGGCDHTLLVAVDNGSDKLIRWYERAGYVRVPGLQDLVGSPDGQYGLAMVGPTRPPGSLRRPGELTWG